MDKKINKEDIATELPLREYALRVEKTDRYKKEDLRPVQMGLYGEVGSLMTAAKKHSREGDAFIGYRNAVVEEFGDTLWYLNAICRRLECDIEEVFGQGLKIGMAKEVLAAGSRPESPIVCMQTLGNNKDLDSVLLELGNKAAPFLSLEKNRNYKKELSEFAIAYLQALRVSGVSFREVIEKNINKTTGRFLPASLDTLPLFDDEFEDDERIPEEFVIEIGPRSGGKVCMKMKGVFIGDPLSDNIQYEDGYRFHDVFHFAHAAILHWSPTFRALIRHKRKSNRSVDEQQDGGRAIVVEEGLTAWIFSCAKELNYFEGATGLSFDMLKTIQQFVSGYEVDQCPLSLWEKAILEGYAVFREVKKNNGGRVTCSRSARSIKYDSAAVKS